MPIRSGGRYRVRNGKPVLEERTGYRPEAEAVPAKKDTATEKPAPKKGAAKKETPDADA
ncbi:hypothetical protein [Salinisphaera sp. T31B1]|uniref:hypothetical protein n=1 Tax=Salinisphaera sp. T31B1 TaxID=727963 RepID=UPI0033414702